MATHCNQTDSSSARTASIRDMVSMCEFVAIGATGAPTPLPPVGAGNRGGYDDPGFTIVRASAGVYNITFPRARFCSLSVTLQSNAHTVVGCVVSALNAPNGTATLHILGGVNAAVSTDPANGDALTIELQLER